MSRASSLPPSSGSVADVDFSTGAGSECLRHENRGTADLDRVGFEEGVSLSPPGGSGERAVSPFQKIFEICALK